MDDNPIRPFPPENPNYIYGTDSEATVDEQDIPELWDDVRYMPPANRDPRMRPHFDFNPIEYRARWRLSGPYPLGHQHESWASEGTNTPEGGLHRSVGRYISDHNRRPRPPTPAHSFDSSRTEEPDFNAVATDPASIPSMRRMFNADGTPYLRAEQRPRPPVPPDDAVSHTQDTDENLRGAPRRRLSSGAGGSNDAVSAGSHRSVNLWRRRARR